MIAAVAPESLRKRCGRLLPLLTATRTPKTRSQLSAGQYTLTDEGAGDIVSIQNYQSLGSGQDAQHRRRRSGRRNDCRTGRALRVGMIESFNNRQRYDGYPAKPRDFWRTGSGWRHPWSQVRPLGGGVLIVGANVTLDNVHLFANQAIGSDGTAGLNGVPGSPDGTDGTDGGEADGGGIYMDSGSLTLRDNAFEDANQATGGNGGDGGDGILDGDPPFSVWPKRFAIYPGRGQHRSRLAKAAMAAKARMAKAEAFLSVPAAPSRLFPVRSRTI